MLLLQRLLSRFFTKRFVQDGGGTPKEAPQVDPLDPIQKRGPAWPEAFRPELKAITDFPVDDSLAGEGAPVKVGDSALKTGAAITDDSGCMDDPTIALKGQNSLGVPEALNMWYMSQSFIGYQACAIIAQHWLVDKACSMGGEDAVRNGWALSAQGGEDLESQAHDAIIAADKEFKIKENLVEFNRFKNIFGIRVAIFKVKSTDPLYYEKPFNIDGVRKDSYEGISQIDPYWMTPVLTTESMSNPAAIGFYEPQFWLINGKKYHKSHLAIARGPQPADILKPTYIFGGVPLVQRIYERVYAAERTANEAPLMAMSKRTMAIHADIEKVLLNQEAFEQRLALWIRYRDNHGIKVLGTEEAMEQFDTVMTDFDSIIMNQYQIVAAIARVPSTKLLGTSPKGFNATGEFESKSYHEELESINEHVMMPMLERHYDILARSLGMTTKIVAVPNPVDSVGTKERAELNKMKSEMGIEYINAGVISPEEERDRIMDDENSGYDRLRDDVQAEAKPGASPENLAEMEKAGAAQTAAETGGNMPPGGAQDVPAPVESSQAMELMLPALLTSYIESKKSSDPAMAALLVLLSKLTAQPAAPVPDSMRSVAPSVKPSTLRSVNAEDAEVVRKMSPARMPKLRYCGLNLFIENPRGTVRVTKDIAGKEWANMMPDHYGFIKGYEGADGQDVDCFIGSNLRAENAFVIVQKNPDTREFDEYKVMLCYDDVEQAIDAYRMSYSNDWDGFDHVLPPMSIDELKSWLEGGGGSNPVPLAEENGMFNLLGEP